MKAMSKQTAVEWLAEQYNLGNGYERHLTESDFEQAKAMEREQIIDAYERGDKYKTEMPGTQYYNETYK